MTTPDRDPMLAYISDHVARTGCGPSAADIRVFVDFSRPGPIGRLLTALERLGDITARNRAKAPPPIHGCKMISILAEIRRAVREAA